MKCWMHYERTNTRFGVLLHYFDLNLIIDELLRIYSQFFPESLNLLIPFPAFSIVPDKLH